jgi:hypothetical protein
MQHVQLEDFVVYIRFRLLDCIGQPWCYKRFLTARKEQKAPWAVQMSAHVQNVQTALRELVQLEQELRVSPLSQLHVVWQHVIESNFPPSELQLTIDTCFITKRQNIPCIVVRGKGRSAQQFTVQGKFAGFFFHLWVIYKMDVLVKLYSRMCIQEVDPSCCMSMDQVVAALDARADEAKAFATSLYYAYSHVWRSVAHVLHAPL